MRKVGMVVTMRSSSHNAQKLGCPSPLSSATASALGGARASRSVAFSPHDQASHAPLCETPLAHAHAACKAHATPGRAPPLTQHGTGTSHTL